MTFFLSLALLHPRCFLHVISSCYSNAGELMRTTNAKNLHEFFYFVCISRDAHKNARSVIICYIELEQFCDQVKNLEMTSVKTWHQRRDPLLLSTKPNDSYGMKLQ